MTDSVQIALIVSIAPSILALANLVNSLRNSAKLKEVHEDTKEVKVATNHMKDELIAATKLASHAEGMQAQRDSEKPMQ